MRFLIAFVSLVLISRPAFAYFNTLDTGEVIQPGHYRAMIAPQVIFNKFSGATVSAAFDTGVDEDQSIRALVGFGEVDFQLGGLYKWVPFPDVADGQPAIGIIGGVVWAKIGDDNALSLRLHPIVSKKFESEVGDFTPYVSLPFGLTDYRDDTFAPIQLVGGTEWKTLHFENLTFMAELGLNLNKAFSYVSAAAVWYFDEEGIRPARAKKSESDGDFR
jgi:hypothetical protein